jgi:hypothetical protein
MTRTPPRALQPDPARAIKDVPNLPRIEIAKVEEVPLRGW